MCLSTKFSAKSYCFVLSSGLSKLVPEFCCSLGVIEVSELDTILEFFDLFLGLLERRLCFFILLNSFI